MNQLGDLEAEQNVLGALLFDPSLLPTVRSKLTTDDWHFTDNATIWSAMVECDDKKIPITLSTLSHRIAGKLRTEDAAYLAHLSGIPSTLDHFARVILRKSQLRRLIMTARAINTRAEQDEDPENIVAGLDAFVRGFTTRGDDLAVPFAESSREVIRSIERRQETGETEAFLSGLPFLDGALYFKPTDLNVIGARPGTGKSWLMTSLTSGICRRGTGLLYVTAEMAPSDVIIRTAKTFAVLDEEVFRERVDDDRAARATDAVWQAGQLPAWTTTNNDAGTVLRLAREMQRRGQIGAVVIDYLQRLRLPTDWGRSRDEQLGHCTSELKQFALENRCPVFLVSSLNRPKDGNPKIKPSMSSLRESGNIESDADNIVLLHSGSGMAVDFIIEKSRNARDKKILKMRKAFDQVGGFEPLPEPSKTSKTTPIPEAEAVEPEPDDQSIWGQG